MTNYADFNRPAFHRAEAEIKASDPDAFIYNPARLQWDDGEPKDYMLIALPMLLTCNKLYVMAGAEFSSGATIERMTALYCGIELIFEEP